MLTSVMLWVHLTSSTSFLFLILEGYPDDQSQPRKWYWCKSFWHPHDCSPPSELSQTYIILMHDTKHPALGALSCEERDYNAHFFMRSVRTYWPRLIPWDGYNTAGSEAEEWYQSGMLNGIYISLARAVILFLAPSISECLQKVVRAACCEG